MSKLKALVIAPGRGTYNASELGYLTTYHLDKKDLIEKLDNFRKMSDQMTITDLDSAQKFKPSIHTKGENAASLIYACAYADFLSINQDKYDVCAITGNSMGWYLALACGEGLNVPGSYELINTMGSMMKDGIIGGQIIYPTVSEEWTEDKELKEMVEKTILEVNTHEDCKAYISINFGGYYVIGGNQAALKILMQKLPQVQERFPMKLTGNGAFHTPLFNEVSVKAKRLLPSSIFQKPKYNLIDGRGQIWHPLMSELSKLYDYTLGHQVVEKYDFTRAVEMGIKEYAPDKIILLGPGTVLGGAIAQILIKNNWLGLKNKSDFVKLQKENPFLLSMGNPEQRKFVV